jgi:F0F1-type ATP synthase membrane subunit a
MGVAPQALEIIFEVQRKTINEKITRKKKQLYNLQNAFFFLLFGPLLLSNLIPFLFLIHLK